MKLLFYLLILLLPTQLGRHFWPNFSFIQGIRVDYLSPTIYLTDILILVILITNYKLLITNLFRYWLLVVFVVLVLVGLLMSQSPFAGLYGFVKLIEYILFAFYVAKTITTHKEFSRIIFCLSLGVVFESVLTIAQFASQGSAGGMFWFFGERTFTPQTIGIANAVVDGILILRPYGTFPHPNVLAGFLVVVMTLMLSPPKAGPPLAENSKKIFFLVSLLVGTLALILTMSRVAIILWVLILFFWGLWKKKSFLLAIVIGVGAIIYLSPVSTRFTNFLLFDESLVRRQELAIAAVEMIKTHPLVGVGIQNFLVNLPQFQQTKSTILYLQPVHNIYLLVMAETGLIGFAIFGWFIWSTIKKLLTTNYLLLTTLIIILVLGLFDHYWLTLQQGQLLFSLTVGLCWRRKKARIKV